LTQCLRANLYGNIALLLQRQFVDQNDDTFRLGERALKPGRKIAD
jgi:hypothetical protein